MRALVEPARHVRGVALARAPCAGPARPARRSRTGSPRGRRCGSPRGPSRARRRTIRSWRASSSKLSAGVSSIRLIERTNAQARAPRRGGAIPSTSSTASATTPALRSSDPRPKLSTVSGSTSRISSGQSRVLMSATTAGRQQGRAEARQVEARGSARRRPRRQRDQGPEHQAADREPDPGSDAAHRQPARSGTGAARRRERPRSPGCRTRTSTSGASSAASRANSSGGATSPSPIRRRSPSG